MCAGAGAGASESESVRVCVCVCACVCVRVTGCWGASRGWYPVAICAPRHLLQSHSNGSTRRTP